MRIIYKVTANQRGICVLNNLQDIACRLQLQGYRRIYCLCWFVYLLTSTWASCRSPFETHREFHSHSQTQPILCLLFFSDYFFPHTVITRWRHVFVAVVRVSPCVAWALWSVFAWKYRYFWMKPLSAAVQSVGGDKDIIVISAFIFVRIIVHSRASKRDSVFKAWCWLSKKRAHFTVHVLLCMGLLSVLVIFRQRSVSSTWELFGFTTNVIWECA